MRIIGGRYSIHAILAAASAAAILVACGGGGGGGGAGGGGTATSTVTAGGYRFAFVTNAANNSISTYSANAVTGRITYTGAVGTGATPYFTAVHPSNKFVYVANLTSNDISAYTVNSANGSLTQIACASGCNPNAGYTSNYLAGSYPSWIAIDPTGAYLYVANNTSSDVSAYSIDGNTGALTQINCGATTGAACSTANTANFAAGTNPRAVTVSGSYVYVTNTGSGNISQYTVSGGGLLPMSPAVIPAGTAPAGIAVDPAGQYAYVTSSSNLLQFRIGANGVLASTGTAVSTGTNSTPVAVAIAKNANGQFLYTANQGTNDVSAFSVSSTGALSQVVCGTTTGNGCGAAIAANFAAGTMPANLTADPSGQFVYVADNGSGDVAEYAITASGGLAALFPAQVPVGTGSNPNAIAMTTAAVVNTPKFTYAVASGAIYEYTVAADGTLSATPNVQVAAPTGSSYVSFAIDPTKHYLYATLNANVTSGTGGVQQFTIDPATGNLTAGPIVGNPVTAACPTTVMNPDGTTTTTTALCTGAFSPVSYTDIAVDPTGKYAYADSNFASNNVLVVFSIGANGALTPMPTVYALYGPYGTGTVGPTTPSSVVVDPGNHNVYVGRADAGQIQQFIIGANGALQPVATFTTGWGGGNQLVMNGPYVYMPNTNNVINSENGIALYSIGSAGTLSQVSCGPVGATGCAGALTPTNFAVDGPNSNLNNIGIDPNGRNIYVPARNGANSPITQLSVGAGGALTTVSSVLANGPQFVSIDTSGKYAYTGNQQGGLTQYAVGSNGALTAGTTLIPSLDVTYIGVVGSF